MKRLLGLLPLLIFLALGLLLWRGLSNDPHRVDSPRMNKPLPDFVAMDLLHPDRSLTQDMFKGHVSLLNVFASWCMSCTQEHAIINDIAKLRHVHVYGLNYKDESANAKKWLREYGNPFEVIIADPHGLLAIDLGVYGTPETFIIDSKARLRYKYTGPLTQRVWQEQLYPVLQDLQEVLSDD